MKKLICSIFGDRRSFEAKRSKYPISIPLYEGGKERVSARHPATAPTRYVRYAQEVDLQLLPKVDIKSKERERERDSLVG